MDDNEFRTKIEKARELASRVGPMHSYWDVISDAERILAGQPSIMKREQVEELFAQLR